MKTKFAYGIVPGMASGLQEAGSRETIRTADENGVAVIFLAGPAAGIAAELTTERFDELYASENGFIKETLSGNKTGGALLFAAVKGNRYLAGHMGGGMIVKMDGSCAVLSRPEADGHDDLRIYRGEVQEPYGFLLMNEGASRSLYESGAEKLSPACGTFFEWLKDYDEETVSEALTDNIDKYFLKNVKGDISVGMMLSVEEEPEQEETPSEPDEPLKTAGPDEETLEPGGREEELPEAARPETEEQSAKEEGDVPPAERGIGGGIFKYLIAALVIAAVVFAFAMKPDVAGPKDAAKPEAKPPATTSQNDNLPAAAPATGPESNEPAVTFSSENPKIYEAGVYQVGEDIPAGEYFFWTGNMLKPDSVKVNDVTCLSGELYCMTVEVGEGDTLVTDNRFTAAENVEPVRAANGTLISGKYKIGKDIAPGTYKISPMDQSAEGKYYSILDGEISNDETFDSENSVVVPDEGYVVFYNAILSVDRK